MQTAGASRTAVLVCQGRACADGRASPGSFADPVAAQLLHPEELRTVTLARATTSPREVRDRLAAESVRASAEVVVPRTVAIDEAISRAGNRQVVIIGAGLDARPWRLDALRDAEVFAVDHPASQSDLRERSAGLTPVARRLVLVPVDLGSDPLGAALSDAGHQSTAPTTWVWEGVVPYLTAGQVRATLDALARRSAAGSVVIVNYQTPSRTAAAGRRLSGLLGRLVGAGGPMARRAVALALDADAHAGTARRGRLHRDHRRGPRDDRPAHRCAGDPPYVAGQRPGRRGAPARWPVRRLRPEDGPG